LLAFPARIRLRLGELVARLRPAGGPPAATAGAGDPGRAPGHGSRGQVLAAELRRRLSPASGVVADLSLRRQYARDLGAVPEALARLLFRTVPDLVVQPATTDDVVATLAAARQLGQPVYPRGVSSWGLGGAVPTRGGIVIDLSPLDAIGDPDPATRTVVVEGGAKWGHVAERVERHGLQLRAYPSSRFSTVGGWIATGGLGLTAFRHGHVARSVRWLELVTPAGQILRLAPDDERFPLVFGSEGQVGLVTRVALALEPRQTAVFPHLVQADDRHGLMALLDRLAAVADDCSITMVKFMDRDLMHCMNELHRELRGAHGARLLQVEERDALLVQVDGEDGERRFREFLDAELGPGMHSAPAHIARHLWHDRFNPLKIQVVGPSLLAGELLIEPARALDYIDAVKQLGRDFHLDVLVESHCARRDDGGLELLLIPMFHSDRRRPWLYMQHLTLVPLLTRLGIRLGGRPYGIGIWNTPFLRNRHAPDHLERLARWKRLVDPHWELNPGKFWHLRTRFANATGWLFRPPIFAWLTDVLLRTSRGRGLLIPRRRPPRLEPGTPPEPPLTRIDTQCTSCGNCVAVCPAYQVTKDERTTARLKLRLGARLEQGGAVAQDEADLSWICTRCGECERVCQAELKLVATYDAIESALEPRFGRPEEAIRTFVEGLGEHPDYLELIDSAPYRAA
jgi:FAD/FMN-containing dehydrogenase/ferredoxin